MGCMLGVALLLVKILLHGQGCKSVLRALLAALSAHSLPGMPTWLGSQQR